MDINTISDQMSRLRGGYRPTDAEVTAWNVAQNVDGLRREIADSDLSWIMPVIATDEGPRAAFYLALLQPLATKAEISEFLAQRFETAGPYLKSQLLWRLLDDAALPAAVHETLFAFVMSDFGSFQSACVAYLGSPSDILNGALGRLAECPATKRWIYFCCLPQYAADQLAVKGLLTVASGSTDMFAARVARSLLDRFFAGKN